MNMKKVLVLLIGLLSCLTIYAQAYRGINIGPEPTRVTINSASGISVSSIQYGSDGAYSICMMNNNYNNPNQRNSYSFKWYLSYKGKRVSDYYNSTIKCREQVTFSQINVWPGTVPNGYEKYVTVQFVDETQSAGRSNSNYTPTAKRVEIYAVNNLRAAATNFRSLIWLYLNKDGTCHYGENDSQGWDTVVEREGTYIIDTNNIIHFTWDNGYEDTATLSYQSSSRALIQYNGRSLVQFLETDDR